MKIIPPQLHLAFYKEIYHKQNMQTQQSLFYYYWHQVLLILFTETPPMQPSSKSSALTNTTLSNMSLSENMTGENSTVEHSLIDPHQPLTYIFGFPMMDQAAFSDRSAKHSRESEKRLKLEPPHYNQPIKCHPSHPAKSTYQSIQIILRNQNVNLKQQNQMLLKEIKRLKTGNQQFKVACRQKKMELEEVRAECKAQKRRGDDIMNTIMDKLMLIEQKFQKKDQSQSECSILNHIEVHLR